MEADAEWDIFDMCSKTFSTSSPSTSPEPCNNPDLKCTQCKENNFVLNEGQYCCVNCGIIPDFVSHNSMEQSYNSNMDKDSGKRKTSRIGKGINPLLPSSSLGSTISANGNFDRSVQQMCKYHKWNSMPYKERSLWTVYSSIHRNAKRGGISNVLIKDAKHIYKQLSEVSISRGSNRKGLIAACVYIACKRHNVPRSAKEIADIFDLKVSQLTKGAKKLMNILNSNHINTSNSVEKSSMTVTNASDFVERFCSVLGLHNKYILLCSLVAERATKYGIVEENTPPSIASGCIFFVINLLKLEYSKKEIASVCNISEVTIGKCYKKLLPYREYLISEEDKKQFNISFTKK